MESPQSGVISRAGSLLGGATHADSRGPQAIGADLPGRKPVDVHPGLIPQRLQAFGPGSSRADIARTGVEVAYEAAPEPPLSFLGPRSTVARVSIALILLAPQRSVSLRPERSTNLQSDV